MAAFKRTAIGMAQLAALGCGPTLAGAGTLSTDTCQATLNITADREYAPADLTLPAACDYFSVTIVVAHLNAGNDQEHNWVLVRAADLDAVLANGRAMMANRALLPRADRRILAASPLLRAGDNFMLSFKVPPHAPNVRYTFFSSTPGDVLTMRGSLKFESEHLE